MDARVKFTNEFMEKTMNKKMSKHRVGETLKEHSKAKLTVGDITIETDDADLIVAIIKGLK